MCDNQLNLTCIQSFCRLISDVMKQITEYRTVSELFKSELEEKKSLFIGLLIPVQNEIEIESRLLSIRKEYPDANHHCYAYKLLSGKLKFADDGEPHRTAGIRILNAIEYYNITNVLLVIVRYFGGIKLGVGPLGKAYYDSAITVLEKSKIYTYSLHKKLNLLFDFSLEPSIRKFSSTANIKIITSAYTTAVKYECLVPVNDEELIINQLKELTNGKIQAHFQDEYSYIQG